MGPKVNRIPFFPIFHERLLLAPALIQKSINIKNGLINFLDGGVGGEGYSKYKHKIKGTGNLDCLRGADEIDVAVHICHFKLCRSMHFHHYR